MQGQEHDQVSQPRSQGFALLNCVNSKGKSPGNEVASVRIERCPLTERCPLAEVRLYLVVTLILDKQTVAKET